MAKRKSTRDTRTDLLPGEEQLAHAYRDTAREAPPAALDAKILAQAKQAVATTVSRSNFSKRWAVPVSIAALMVLSLSVVLQVSQREVPDTYEAAPAVATAPTPQPAAPEPARKEKAQPPSETKPALTDKAHSTGSASRGPAVAQAPEMRAAGAAANDERAREAAGAPAATARSKGATDQTMTMKQLSADVTAPESQLLLNDKADVISVRVSGQPGGYEFLVGVRSPDSGCPQYADWWEIVGIDGALIYRNVLPHSHADEQPFTRAGGPVAIQPDTVVWVRAHMSNSGYGGAVFRGSIEKGFSRAPLTPDFAATLAKQPPRPPACQH